MFQAYIEIYIHTHILGSDSDIDKDCGIEAILVLQWMVKPRISAITVKELSSNDKHTLGYLT